MKAKFLLLTLSLIFMMWTAEARAQNILYLMIDTLTISPDTRDIIVNVRYRLQTTHSHSLHGYDTHIAYDDTKLSAVDAFKDGTASAYIGYFLATFRPELSVVALGSNEIDLTNPVLYRVRFSVRPGATDTAWLRWHNLRDAVPLHDTLYNIDSIVQTDGWVRILPVKYSMLFSSPTVTAQADSLFELPIKSQDPVQAHVRAVRITIPSDSNYYRFRGIRPGSSLDTVYDVQASGTQLSWTVATKDTTAFLPAGPLVQVQYQAQHRKDTTCLSLGSASVTILNSDALVSAINVVLNDVCIQGKAEIPGGVEAELPIEDVQAWPNPCHGELNLRSDAEARPVVAALYDLMGRCRWSASWRGTLAVHLPDSIPEGAYELVLSREETDGSHRVMRQRLLIVH